MDTASSATATDNAPDRPHVSTPLSSRDAVLLAILCAIFVALAWPFVRGMGIEVDEAVGGSSMHAQFSRRIAGYDIPLMVVSYVGALKIWLCAPLLAIWGPGPVTLRLPSVLLGAGSVATFWLLLERLCGRKAAWTGAVLLATDTTFLHSAAIDFGPAMAQVFLKTAGLWILVEWKRSGRTLLLAIAFFLFGLAFWDKAVFLWIAAGIGAGALAAFPRQMMRAITPRQTAIAIASLCVGAAPLILYNIARPLDTLRSNARLDPGSALAKAVVLRDAMDGRALLGFYTAADVPPRPGRSRVPVPAFRRNCTVWIFTAAVLAIPFLWRTPARTPAIFGVVSFAVGWLAMAVSGGAGAAAHHVVLLWPLHFLVIAVVLSRVRGSMAVVTILVAVNLMVTARYGRDLMENGPGIRWTRAVEPLMDELRRLRPDLVFVADWGILETINVLSSRGFPLLFGNEYTSPATPQDREAVLREVMARPGTYFLTHVDQWEQTPGVNAAIQSFAERAGYQRRVVSTIHDQFNRPVFMLLQFN